MCSNLEEMEKYGGDLTDILRAGGRNISGEASGMTTDTSQFHNRPVEYQFQLEDAVDEFGDPFSHLQDPLLHHTQPQGSGFFSNSTNMLSCSLQNQGRFGGDQSVTIPKMVDQEDLRRPANNFFTRMLQISPNTKTTASPRDSSLVGASPRGVKDPMLGVKDMISSSKGENNAGGLQISSPRNAGIKRRKSQAKKVVCIPAPAPVNSRPSGEVVPSDLWAWRKYGQKPIKGSPYPRGYYRCSSSKGCPARKQVERSRTDPNMLVITYTCEHNHPWPTQRNALAGSTRTQPSKTPSSNPKTSAAPVISQSHKSTHSKPENNDTQPPSSILSLNCSTSANASVKEEAEDHEKQMEVDDAEFRQVFQHSYKPALPDSNQPDDFFAELGELEADPMNLLFPDGYSVVEDRENKSLDPFTFYDWAGGSTGSSLCEEKKGS